MEDIVVSGVALSKNEAKIDFRGIPDKPGVAAMIMGRFSKAGLNVDMIVQTPAAAGVTDLSLTVNRAEVAEAKRIAHALVKELGGRTVDSEENIAKLSVVGIGMRSHTGVAEKMFSVLAAENVNIKMISTSEIKISVIIGEEAAEKALNAVHRAFELHKPRS